MGEFMVSLSDNLSNLVSIYLNKEKVTREFSEEELEKVTVLSLSKNDIEFIQYFKNIEELELSQFPSINEKDIEVIGKELPNLKSLKIKEQSALVKLDLTCFQKLEELELVYNDNLISLSGVGKLKKFTFYDNKDFVHIQQIAKILCDNKDAHVTLDIVYYANLIRCFKELDEKDRFVDNYVWMEATGLRKHEKHIYTNEEVKELMELLTNIVSKYLYVTDGEIEKFGVLYYWMIQNVQFVNEDDPKNEDVSKVSNISQVFKYRKGGRLSYAKAFQLLLSFANVKSAVVYSLGALDTIGYYNGKQVYSLLGTSDYALLRISIDGRYYYCDIAWDSMVHAYKYFDALRLLLVSKDELKLRHKFVGEGNIISSFSYHGDDSDDLIMFAGDRIKVVDEVFDDIERFKPAIVGVEMNISMLRKEIAVLKDKLDKTDEQNDINKVKQELVEAEESLNQEEIELVKLNKQRIGVVESYAGFLNEHYVGFLMEQEEEVITQLTNKKDMLLLSDYIFKILCCSVKATF